MAYAEYGLSVSWDAISINKAYGREPTTIPQTVDSSIGLKVMNKLLKYGKKPYSVAVEIFAILRALISPVR